MSTEILGILGKHFDPRHPQHDDILLYQAANAAGLFVAVWSSIGVRVLCQVQIRPIRVYPPFVDWILPMERPEA